MTKAVKFHNRVIRHPGAEAFTDLSGMVQPGVDTTRIAGIVGEAPNGQPGVLHVFADSQSAKEFFGAGSDLADAIRVLMEPSNDDDVDGGAVLVYAYNAKKLTQAERWLVRDPLRNPDGTVLAVPLVYTVTAAVDRDDSTNPITPAYLRFDSGVALPINVFQNLIVEVISGWGKGQQYQIKGNSNPAGTVTQIDLRDDLDWTVTPFKAGQTTTIRIAIPEIKLLAFEWGPRGNDLESMHKPNDSLDNTKGYEIHSRNQGRLANRIVPVGGELLPTLSIKFDPIDGAANLATPANWVIQQAVDGGPVGATTTGAATATLLDGEAGLTPTAHNDRWVVITGGLTPAQLAIVGKMYKIATSAAGDVTLVGAGTGFVTGAGLEWKVLALTNTTLEVTGRDGEALSMKVVVTDTGAAFVADLANIDLTKFKTIAELERRIKEISGLFSLRGDAVADNVLVSRFDFGEANDGWQADIIRGPEDPWYVVRDNTQKLVDFINSDIAIFSAERAGGLGSSDPTTGYNDEIGGAQPENDADVFKRFYHGEVGDSQVLLGDNTSIPGYPVSWEHGLDMFLRQRQIRVEGICASDDLEGWASGDIDVLINRFQSHLIQKESNKGEAQGYAGLSYPLFPGTFGGRSYARGLLDVIRFLNEPRMSLAGQTTQVESSAGFEEVLPPWAFALQVAGIQMGTDIGESATLKQVKTAALGQPLNDWDPLDPTDLDNALKGSLLYGEPEEGFWRVVRHFTTHSEDDNLGKTDANVWEVRNDLQRGVRTLLERRFGGQGIGTNPQGVRYQARASIANIREAMATYLEEKRADGIIVDSQDEQGLILHAWRGLSVKINGDVARVRVQIFPKTALNFILIDFTFQIPRFSA